MNIIKYIIIVLLLVLLILNNQYLIYAAIISIVIITLNLLREKYKPKPISKKQYLQLDKLYKKYNNIIDLSVVPLVFIETYILYKVLNILKDNIITIPKYAIYTSNPKGQIFLAAFILSISTIGWLYHKIIKITLEDKYWTYYCNRSEVKLNTKKVYKYISVIGILISIP